MNKINNIPRSAFDRSINFIYAALIVTTVASLISVWLLIRIDKAVAYSEKIIETQARNDKHSWEGKWTLVGEDQSRSGDITISSSNGARFLFEVNARSDKAHSVWKNFDSVTQAQFGTITVKNNVATYVDDKDLASDGKPCVAVFQLIKDGIGLALDTNCNENYAGKGVSFNGIYKKGIKILNADESTNQ